MQDPQRQPVYPYPSPAQPAYGYNLPQSTPTYPYGASYDAPPQPYPRASSFRLFFVVFLTIIVLIGIGFLIYYLVMRPQLPEITLMALSVTGFNVTRFDQVYGNWNLQFLTVNPNKKMSMVYHDVDCGVSYGRIKIADTRLPPFVQRAKDQRIISGAVTASGTYVDYLPADRIIREAARGIVNLDVFMDFVAWHRAGMLRGLARRYVVFCYAVPITLTNYGGSGKMNGPGVKCRLYK